jgi:hypothetical protein
MYNLNSLTQSRCILVPLVGAEQLPERRLLSRRSVVALIVVLGLTVSLAGRVFSGDTYSTTAIHSGVSSAKVQHRDADAVRWAPPAPLYSLLWTAERSLNAEPVEQAYFHPHYDSLYNRPPPIG